MANVIITLNSAGIEEMLKGPDVQSMLKEYANRVASQAGTGFGNKVEVRETRAVATVFPETDEAAHESFANNVLLKALR